MVLSVLCPCLLLLFFFFFNDTATTEIYTLSLHDALPISAGECEAAERSVPALRAEPRGVDGPLGVGVEDRHVRRRSEEHTSELQSRLHLVCRLLLEKKKYIHCTLNGYNAYRPLPADNTVA